MIRKSMMYSVRIGVIAFVFAAGYLSGSMTQHSANAGVADLGGYLMKKAGKSGGALGTAAQLGTTITDMQKNINGLQKNLETFKKVKSMLGDLIRWARPIQGTGGNRWGSTGRDGYSSTLCCKLLNILTLLSEGVYYM